MPPVDGPPTTDATSTPVDAAAPPLDLDAVTAELAAVEAALARLDDGSYGTCLACAADIADEVLAASPTQPTCDAHLPV